MLGAQCTVNTDNDPLSYIQTSAKLGTTETRWIGELAQFNLTIRHRSGKKNKNADSLSRKVKHGTESTRLEEVVVVMSEHKVPTTTVLPSDLKLQIKEDRQVVRVEAIHAQDEPLPSTHIPSVSADEMRKLQREDSVISRFLHFLDQSSQPSLRMMKKEGPDARKLLKCWKQMVMLNGVLYRRSFENNKTINQIIVPKTLLTRVLKSSHDENGHQSPERTYLFSEPDVIGLTWLEKSKTTATNANDAC